MKTINIAGYSAFWGDSAYAAEQLVHRNDVHLDYLVGDYLAEVTMGLLARRSKFSNNTNKSAQSTAYISEFLDDVLAPLLPRILEKGIKVITNAGGLDPVGLKEKIETHASRIGLGDRVTVAAVFGDDVLDSYRDILATGHVQGFDPLNGSGQAEDITSRPQDLLSLNAYIGAEAITKALQAGANIIVTGRCVDSASIVGPLAFEYGWNFKCFDDQRMLDNLAASSLAGHILECGAQATGGNFTDWRESASSAYGGWANMGYPIASFQSDGTFEISKPPSTGGLVTCGTVCEQMLYEVLDPENYVLPDVIIDLSRVQLTQVTSARVRITGAKGKPPTPWLKCTAIAQKGFRMSVDFMVFGTDAEEKGHALIDAMVRRANGIIESKHHGTMEPISSGDFKSIIVGAERSVAPHARGSPVREVLARLSASHSNVTAFKILSKEVSSFITSSCPGVCLLNPAKPKPAPNFTTASVLVNREVVVPRLVVGKSKDPVQVPFSTQGCQPIQPSQQVENWRDTVPQDIAEPGAGNAQTMKVRLIDIAMGRSGDKGDTANIAIIARKSAFYPYILKFITPESIRGSIGHYIAGNGTVTRYKVPGVRAVNFVITNCLGGGGLASLSLDKQAKGYAQIVLSNMWVEIPSGLLQNGKL